MITRIVKMEIKQDQVEAFLKFFVQHALKMESVTGCLSLRLVQDLHASNLFFTISEWQEENDLEAYRTSALFTLVWSNIKPLFCAKATAWSTQSIYHGKN